MNTHAHISKTPSSFHTIKCKCIHIFKNEAFAAAAAGGLTVFVFVLLLNGKEDYRFQVLFTWVFLVNVENMCFLCV